MKVIQSCYKSKYFSIEENQDVRVILLTQHLTIIKQLYLIKTKRKNVRKKFINIRIITTFKCKFNGRFLMMATTTSTDDTGLLDYLAPKFEKDN